MTEIMEIEITAEDIRQADREQIPSSVPAIRKWLNKPKEEISLIRPMHTNLVKVGDCFYLAWGDMDADVPQTLILNKIGEISGGFK